MPKQLSDAHRPFARRMPLAGKGDQPIIHPGQRAIILADGRDAVGEVGSGPLDEHVRAN